MKNMVRTLLGAASLGLLSLAAHAQSNWYPSKWGPNDEIGAANYLTPAVALNAAKLVKTGKTYSLGITVNTTTPAYPPRTCSIYIVQPGQTGLGRRPGADQDDLQRRHPELLDRHRHADWTAWATSAWPTATTTATSGKSSPRSAA